MYLDARYNISTDLGVVRVGLATKKKFEKNMKAGHLNIYYQFRKRAKANPDKVYIIFENKEYTYHDIEKASNRLANWLLEQNVQKKDRVCMMLQNHPTFIILWLAIIKIGAIAVFINTNLSDDSLLHCIKIVDSKMVLFDPLYQEQVSTIRSKIDVPIYAYGDAAQHTEQVSSFSWAPTLTPSILATYTDYDVNEDFIKHTTMSDTAMFVYTSGTTGMPKASPILHSRALVSSLNISYVLDLQSYDRIYMVLPLYHISATLNGILAPLYNGATLVLGRKFSAKYFWDDISRYKATIFIYIGELCRYLISRPVHPQEKNHNLRIIAGNGMSADVWSRLRSRFNIPHILEFYGSTEAPIGIYAFNKNNYGLGAVGRYGPLIRAVMPNIKFVKIDPITDEPLRNADGFLVQCKINEEGELLVLLESDPNSTIKFSGYFADTAATEKKIIRNAFRKGDSYFRSGDLLRLTDDGFVYFVDRVGDTFRWKSENVSTTEVAQVVSTFPGILNVNVYGALVPGHEGRASMAAITIDDEANFDFAALAIYLKRKLPSYAVPIFLRTVRSMNTTATFKVQKVKFRNQGIQPDQIPKDEHLYWLQGETYLPFGGNELDSIRSGQAKL
ncbi:hypothetical protein BC941DRAFT_411291 [Chlamydoabsidia padenii]|nr:hypothetical protein BC941DRAFT_411291 [Chlamydoabsidia padenii]